MSGLILTITDAGRAALVNASNTGTTPVLMASVGVSATSFTPSPAATTLPDEIKRITTIAGEAVADDTIHVTVRDESADIYTVRSFGLYLADGTLFAVYSQANPIMEKSAQALLLLAIDVIFADIEATDIVFGDASFTNPPATTERQGVVELATDAETETGSDAVRAVTPKGLKAAVIQWLNDRFGEGAPSAFIKGLLTAASAAVLRAALEIKSAALKDEGEGKGLDADLLDGQHGSFYTNIIARLGYTPWGPSNDGAGSGLDADTLDGLQANAFALSSHAHDYLPPTSIGTYASYAVDKLRGGYYGLLFGLNTTAPVVMFNSEGKGGIYSQVDATWRFYFDGIDWHVGAPTGQKVWHAGNDGSGSGLDADTLDGLHASAFLRTLTDTWLSIGGIPRLHFSASGWSYLVGDGRLILRGGGATGPDSLTIPGTGNLLHNGYTIWTAANDGSGSGLDADLLDGLHASTFAKLADFVASKATNGYCRLPNGMIIQAGRYSQNANTLISVVFPLAFPNMCMGVVTNGTGDASFGAEGNTPTVYSGSVTTGGFQSHNANDNGTTAYFIAFGY